jgi:hypothetical protein
MKTISEQLGTIIGLGIDLNHFFSVTVGNSGVSLLGYHTNELEKHLRYAGFETLDYLYEDNPNWLELSKDGCRVALDKS